MKSHSEDPGGQEFGDCVWGVGIGPPFNLVIIIIETEREREGPTKLVQIERELCGFYNGEV